MNQNKRNVAHSIFQRLLNRAKSNQEHFNHLLTRYGMERFLYRLSISSSHDRFVLKGASLFLAWKGQSYRVTRDADLLGFGSSEIEHLAAVFRDIAVFLLPVLTSLQSKTPFDEGWMPDQGWRSQS